MSLRSLRVLLVGWHDFLTSTTSAVAFGVNEALKRAFPDESKSDPTKRPDLVKPFLMVRTYHVERPISDDYMSYHAHTHGGFAERVRSQGAALQLSCYQAKW